MHIGHFREIADPRVILGRHGQIPQMGQAAADVLDVVVDAEDLFVEFRARPAMDEVADRGAHGQAPARGAIRPGDLLDRLEEFDS